MSRLPRPLARRIDRLARAAHRFHRFAHHPLCAAYRGEVLASGRWRICRGCSLALAGGLLGSVLGTGLHLPPWMLPAVLGLLGLLLAAQAFCRLPKGAGRFLPALCLGLLAGQGLRLRTAGACLAACAAAGLGLAALVLYRRRGPQRGPCVACPVGPPGRTCPGFAPMLRRERAFARLTSRWLG